MFQAQYFKPQTYENLTYWHTSMAQLQKVFENPALWQGTLNSQKSWHSGL